MISLKTINMDNFHAVINIKMSDDDRKMVASNTYSMAEAYADQVSVARAIYSNDQLVGFIMYDYNAADKTGYVSRLMIATDYQGKGIGTEALRQVIETLRNIEGIKKIQISYHPRNIKAKKSYAKLGFVENGSFVGEEAVAIIDLA